MNKRPPHDKPSPTIDADSLWRARDVIKDAFALDFTPVEASSDDLVTVWLDSGCRLTRVMIHDAAALDPVVRERLESALVAATRKAADKVATVHTERVTAELKRRKLL